MSDAEPLKYPMTSWTMSGFRAIRDETSFELGGLNVFVGANSAGKSSVLQSVLMVAQTLGNPLADKPLVFNGPLVRLGLVDDVLHEAAEGKLHLSFSLQRLGQQHWREDFEAFNVSADFERADSRSTLELREATIRVDDADEESAVTVKRRTIRDAVAAYREAGLTIAQARAAASQAPLGIEGTLPKGTGGVRNRQFLPDLISVISNSYVRELEELQLRRRAVGGRAIGGGGRGSARPISPPVRRFLAQFIKDEVDGPPRALGQVRTVGDLFQTLDRTTAHALGNLFSTTWYAEHRADLPFKGVPELTRPPSPLDTGIEFARRWFANSIRYLGPIRAAPQPLYELPEAASGTSVGRNGEYTAAVLAAYGNVQVFSPSPVDGQTRRIPLREAVDEWVSAIDLLSSVRSQERGKLGYELHLGMEGVARDLDLTSVGVGVSQALPVLVLGLLSAPGVALLFEQPELHLHPDVQAALGDFFLALTRSGRQVIVETHSEYLVNRLRRRAAEQETDVAELVRLFFFERAQGRSRVQPARIGVGGGMPNWPRGFLDTAAREVEAIARAHATVT